MFMVKSLLTEQTIRLLVVVCGDFEIKQECEEITNGHTDDNDIILVACDHAEHPEENRIYRKNP